METGGHQTSRVALVGDETVEPAVLKFYADIRDKGGQPINMHRTLAIAPPMMEAARAAAYAIRYDAILPRSLRELAIIRISQLNGGTYEEMQHRPMAMSCGLSLRQLDEIAAWRESGAFDEQQMTILAYVDALNRSTGPSDAEFAGLRQYLSDREIVELTFIATTYAGLSMFTRALRTPLEPDAGNPANPYGKIC